MDILIHADGLVVSEDLKSTIEEKIGRIEQYAPRAIRARVHLRKTSAHPSDGQFVVTVTCQLPGRDLTAEQHGADILTPIDLVTEKIERQLRKRKTKLLDRRTHDLKKKPSARSASRTPRKT